MLLGWGGLGIFAIALVLHTWGLGWFNSLVFDEVYYVPFALNYLEGQPVFDAHPPLGKYLIALAIALGQFPAEWFHWPSLQLHEHLISPLSYRWLNALVGSTLPGLVGLLGFFISAVNSPQRRVAFAFLAGGLMLLAGLPLVESRLALINIYWVWFGILGQLCWVIAKTREKSLYRNKAGIRSGAGAILWRIAAGCFLGAAINVKWNGAGFWLGILLLESVTAWQPIPKQTRLALLWKPLLLYLGLIPLLTYGLLWIPHLGLNQVSFFEIHRQLWMAHQSISGGAVAHPYCSAWYTWPLMLRPVSYFYEQVVGSPPDSILAPVGTGDPITYTLQGMGNPLLWWFATAAVVALAATWVSQSCRHFWITKARKRNDRRAAGRKMAGNTHPTVVGGYLGSPGAGEMGSPVVSFVLVNYAANWLPWLLVNRCTFLYHALGMVVFSTLGLAWLLSRWLLDRRQHHRIAAWIIILLILWGFVFWLPVFIGLPLAPEALQQRWWLRTWI